MAITGHCDCNNISIRWHCIDHSLVPRACQCDYCSSHRAAYVSKSASRVEINIQQPQYHRSIQHGSHSAVFHECSHCRQVVFVTADIDGVLYGALNARLLDNKISYTSPVATDFSEHSGEQKRQRWSKNWCYPVIIETATP